jgi:transposase-like protein
MNKVTISTREFFQRFPDEITTRIYMEDCRWNGSPVCPHCGNSGKMYKQTRKKVEGYYRCPDCKKVFTVRTGTIFGRSHISLNMWLYAMYLLVTARKGISSLQLSKEIGITQKSAWFMLQRLRTACGNNGNIDCIFLRGIIEADEAYLGGRESNKHASKKLRIGRGAVGKVAVLGIRERGGKVKANVVKNTGAKTIQAKVRAAVASGSILCTDEHRSYQGMPEYLHCPVNHSVKQFVDGMAHTNGIESVWAVLKRGFYGIYHSFSHKHLQRYVDEFVYRLNEGNCAVHTMDRIDALLRKATGKRITYKDLVLAT